MEQTKKIKIYKTMLLTVLLLLSMVCISCGGKTEGYMKVCVRDRDSGKELYQIICTNGQTVNTDKFDSDDFDTYSVDIAESFAFSVGNGIGKMVHTHDVIRNAEGRLIKDDTMSKLVDAVYNQTDHMIFACTIIRDADKFFAFVEMNTNWRSPCYLYEYDVDQDCLTELHRWDNVDLISLSMSL